MPTTYAHDLFGKEVYRRLPADMRYVIRRHGDLYRIGLHGPDILFYYMVSKNPVTQFGVRMHQEKARTFFQEGMRQVRRTKDEALLAYLLGFGCHYMLDSACHPYVNKMADEGVVPHIVLEKEFDRVLMEETEKRSGSLLSGLRHHPEDVLCKGDPQSNPTGTYSKYFYFPENDEISYQSDGV